MNRKLLSQTVTLAGILFLLVVWCSACGPADHLISVIQAILSSIGVVLTYVGPLLAPGEAAAIETGVSVAENGVNVLKTVIDDYEANPQKTGIASEVEAGFKAVQDSLAALENAAQVKNATVRTWITNIVNLASDTVQNIITKFMPMLKEGIPEAAVCEKLGAEVKAVANDVKEKYDVLTNESGLPAEAVAAAKKHVADKMAPHVGPIRV